MFDAVQETISRLGASLERSVVLVDSDLDLIAASRHFGDLDAAQIHLLTTRTGDAGLNTRLRGVGPVPMVIEAAVIEGSEYPRLCVTLRSLAQTFGHLLVTVANPLMPSEYLQVIETAEVLRRLIENMTRSIDDVNQEVEREMLALLIEEPISRDRAATELLGLGMFVRSRYFVAVCLRLDTLWPPWDGPPVRDIVTRVIARGITTPRLDAYAFVPTAPESFILIGFRHPPSSEALRGIVGGLLGQLALAREGIELSGRIGVGGTENALANAWRSYDQAVVAANIARSTSTDHSFWGDAPVAASLAALFAPVVPEHLRPGPLQRLESAPAHVVELLEVFFEQSGSASAMAERLGIHRATVYQRLGRVRTTIGLDLDRGDDRLIAHAWLTRRRFTR